MPALPNLRKYSIRTRIRTRFPHTWNPQLVVRTCAPLRKVGPLPTCHSLAMASSAKVAAGESVEEDAAPGPVTLSLDLLDSSWSFAVTGRDVTVAPRTTMAQLKELMLAAKEAEAEAALRSDLGKEDKKVGN